MFFVAKEIFLAVLFLGCYFYGVILIDEFEVLVNDFDFLDKVE